MYYGFDWLLRSFKHTQEISGDSYSSTFVCISQFEYLLHIDLCFSRAIELLWKLTLCAAGQQYWWVHGFFFFFFYSNGKQYSLIDNVVTNQIIYIFHKNAQFVSAFKKIKKYKIKIPPPQKYLPIMGGLKLPRLEKF